MPITQSQSGQTRPLLSSVAPTPNMDQNQPLGTPFNPSRSPLTQNWRQQSQVPPAEPVTTNKPLPTDPLSEQRPPTPGPVHPSTFFNRGFYRGPTGFREPVNPEEIPDDVTSPQLQGQDSLDINEAQSHALKQIFQNF